MSQSVPVVTHRTVHADGIDIHLAEAGLLVLLLHGFPELWYSWRRPLPALADAGYHAIAPDVTGVIDALGHDHARSRRARLGSQRALFTLTEMFWRVWSLSSRLRVAICATNVWFIRCDFCTHRH